jgi:predicted nucleotide-binding protein (sugar kinase/HSP70/actin superfamily)
VGNLTWKHERLIRAIFEGAGYRCRTLPTPDRSAFQVGKEYCNNGLCNPAYFTLGSLVQYLRRLEKQGLSRRQIVENFVYITAGSCGPCRFGMYEAEYRRALHDAGFPGFRILTFQMGTVIREGAKEPGLRYNFNFGLGILNALILSDLLYQLAYRIRPYEVHPGETDKVTGECVEELAEFLRTRSKFRMLQERSDWLSRRLAKNIGVRDLLNRLGKYHEHLYGKAYKRVLTQCVQRLNRIEVDRTRPLPIVKVVGEFFSQLVEGDANYDAFSFLGQEGAEVLVEPVSSLIPYYLYEAKWKRLERKGLDAPYPDAHWWEWRRHLANAWAFYKHDLLFILADRLFTHQYHRALQAFGGLGCRLIPQEDLKRFSDPYFSHLVRGGEGHLEVAKSIYYTQNQLCHMVLSLKPFGCMPSTQSDGAMAAVANQYDEMLFLSVETSGEGEANAHSRMQMVLSEARRKARTEFERVLRSTGKSLEEIQAYVRSHAELQRPFYVFPRSAGVAGTAAHFIQHVTDLMDKERVQ